MAKKSWIIYNNTNRHLKIGRKIRMLFHCFEKIHKYSKQLLCTGDIGNTEDAINVYDKFEKKCYT